MRKFSSLIRKAAAQGKSLAGAALVVGMSTAHAATDVTEITGAKTEIAAVGAAVFGVYLAIKLTKWVRHAL